MKAGQTGLLALAVPEVEERARGWGLVGEEGEWGWAWKAVLGEGEGVECLARKKGKREVMVSSTRLGTPSERRKTHEFLECPSRG